MNNTFVVVTWNNEKVIGKLIKSINYYENDSKIIVVDNNSLDKTVKIAASFTNVKVISLHKNLGFAKANNVGFKSVKTKYVTFINPDVILTESVIDKLILKLEKEKIGMIGIRLTNADGTLQPTMYNFQTPFNIFIEQFRIGKLFSERMKIKYSPENSKHDQEKKADWLIGAFLFTKSLYYEEVGGFSEDYFLYSEDMDICYKYHLKGLSVVFYPKVSAVHIGSVSENQTDTGKNLKLLNSFTIFARKYNKPTNIKALYYCYIFKYLLARYIDEKRSKKYKANIRFLKGELK